MLIEKTSEWRGEPLVTHWRELTAGEANKLLEGQSVRREESGGVMVIDVQLNDKQNKLLVQMTMCDADGKPVYKTLERLMAEPQGKVRALIMLAQAARAEFDGGGEGNE